MLCPNSKTDNGIDLEYASVRPSRRRVAPPHDEGGQRMPLRKILILRSAARRRRCVLRDGALRLLRMRFVRGYD
jgi:hypothetical protein